ncbi:uncharacterized protein LOC136081305 [Hydra vulgaris]|uniref:Uncharacterized protein LOC136081305 n=1 Tax=Hydra vulgaris TaxID=6087 RepID=A0ABM4BZJ6_HYDVU
MTKKAQHRYSTIGSAHMIMEDCEGSEDDDIEVSDPFSAYTISSLSLTASESSSEDNNTKESDGNQFTDVYLATTAEDFLMPSKKARTTGGLAYNQSQNKAQQVDLISNISPDKTTSETNPSGNSNQWKDEPNIVKQIQFTDYHDLKINMESKKPFNLFRLFVTEVINTMAAETNRSANKFRRYAAVSWVRVRVLLHMGCVKWHL